MSGMIRNGDDVTVLGNYAPGGTLIATLIENHGTGVIIKGESGSGWIAVFMWIALMLLPAFGLGAGFILVNDTAFRILTVLLALIFVGIPLMLVVASVRAMAGRSRGMRRTRSSTKPSHARRAIVVAAIIVAIIGAAVFGVVRSHQPTIQAFGQWQVYDGQWALNGSQSGLSVSDVNANTGGLEEDKAIISTSNWLSFYYSANVQMDSIGQVGLIFRVTDPSSGVNQFTGYYAGVDLNRGGAYLVLGRMSNSWTPLVQPKLIAASFNVGQPYSFSVQASGCFVSAFIEPAPEETASVPGTGVQVDDANGCINSPGALGLRDLVGSATWTNISAAPSDCSWWHCKGDGWG